MSFEYFKAELMLVPDVRYFKRSTRNRWIFYKLKIVDCGLDGRSPVGRFGGVGLLNVEFYLPYFLKRPLTQSTIQGRQRRIPRKMFINRFFWRMKPG